MHQHFDAEQLAAFADGSLSREERAAAEAHAADCPRCLQLLAAMVRIEDAPAAASPRRRVPVVLRWSVPLLAGAAALALWINVRPRLAVEVPPVPVQSPQAAPSATVAAKPPSLPDRKDKQDERALWFEAKKRESVDRLQAKAGANQSPARTEQQPRARQEGPVSTVVESAPPLPAATPSAAPAPAPIADASAPRSLESSRQFRTDQAVVETLTVGQRGTAPLEVMSPDRSSGWRIVGRAIVRSTDGGKTWAAEQVPVQSELLAGSSPSARVAWFVGRAGYILLTTATNQWRRVTFPESIDLAAVSALSERDAQVTTSDGRVFATSDGGQTWRPR